MKVEEAYGSARVTFADDRLTVGTGEMCRMDRPAGFGFYRYTIDQA